MDYKNKLIDIKQQNLYRSRKILANNRIKTTINNKKVINFCSNDYLSLANDKRIKKSLKKAIDLYGASSSSSQLISGYSLNHQQLEEELSDYIGAEKAVLFSTGYMANLGIFSTLKDDVKWILQDKLNHASLIDANNMINIPVQRYLHNNMLSLQKKINKQQGFGMVATDNIFSMDGDKAHIDELYKIANNNNAILLQDDAHGFGIFKTNFKKKSIYMATFGKAAGSVGAFVAGDSDFIEYLVQKSRPYIYTTAPPRAYCIATLTALKIIKTNEKQQKLFNNINFFKKLIKTDSNTAIHPIIIGDNKKVLAISNYLLKCGFYVGAVRKPTVNSARLRITINADHSEKQIKSLAEALIVKL